MAGFKMVTKKTFWWPVKIKVPSEKRAGRFDIQTIEVEFMAMPKAEIDERAKERADLDSDNERRKFDDQSLRASIVGWKASDVTDEDGVEVAFSEVNLETVLQFAWSRIGFLEAFAHAMSGEPAKGN